MSKWFVLLGYTRIIHSVATEVIKETGQKRYNVVWYQGNLPPVVPVEKLTISQT